MHIRSGKHNLPASSSQCFNYSSHANDATQNVFQWLEGSGEWEQKEAFLLFASAIQLQWMPSPSPFFSSSLRHVFHQLQLTFVHFCSLLQCWTFMWFMQAFYRLDNRTHFVLEMLRFVNVKVYCFLIRLWGVVGIQLLDGETYFLALIGMFCCQGNSRSQQEALMRWRNNQAKQWRQFKQQTWLSSF